MSNGSFIWVKGSLHTHTTESDGDASPDEVAEWFHENGYQFLVISDHGKVTDPAKVKSNGLLLISGIEIDTTLDDAPIHLNGLGVTSALEVKSGTRVSRIIQGNIDLIRKAGGIPMVNHPNWYYAFGHRELLPVDRPYLLEILNMSDDCNNPGDPAHISVEQVWDILLSEGRTIYATATDDSHHYKEFSPHHYNPGLGWVVVKVKELTVPEVLGALDKGDFYSSTGVELGDIRYKNRTLKVRVRPKDKTSYTIRFIGKHGRILSEKIGIDASCKLVDDEENGYIRAKVISSEGTVACTQAFRRVASNE